MTVAPPVTDRASLGERLAVLGVMAFGAFLRFSHLGSRSLWTDEGSTWTAATLPLRALVHRCLERDASPPLYYMLESAALRFGDSEAHLRAISAISSVVLIWLTYRLARLALDRGASTLAALFCACSPYQVMYAQEARTYALVAAFSVGATWLYAHSILARGRGTSWRAYALVTAMGLWTQSLAMLALPAQGVVALSTPEGRRSLRPWLVALTVAFLVYAPWGWMSRNVGEHLGSSHWYVPDPDVNGVFKVLRAVFVAPSSLVTAPQGTQLAGLEAWLPRPAAWALLILPLAAVLAAGMGALLERGPRGVIARLAWGGWLLPMVAVFVVSLRSPLFLPRYFVFATPYAALCMALGFERVRVPLARVVLAAVLVAISLFGVAHYEMDFQKEHWREAASDIRTLAEPGRTAVLVPFDLDPLAYYLRDGKSGVRAFEVSHPEEPFAANYTPRQLDEMIATARANVAAYNEVWVVVRSPNSAVRHEVMARTEAVAGEGRTTAPSRDFVSFGGPLWISRFRRTVTDSTK